MAKYAGRNEEELEQLKSMQLFYVDGKSKAGRPVFYYIARKYMWVKYFVSIVGSLKILKGPRNLFDIEKDQDTEKCNNES